MWSSSRRPAAARAFQIRAPEGINASASQLWRILTGMQIRLDRVRGWLNRRDDPEFWNRVRDVVGLHLDSPGEKALASSVGEKTAIQAKERRYPDQLPGAGRSPALDMRLGEPVADGQRPSRGIDARGMVKSAGQVAAGNPWRHRAQVRR